MYHYMTTYSGEKIAPLDPEPERINITDIAHALSMLCRASGHLKHFFSVGQHCVNCANEAKARGLSKRVQLACLLHDGSEAYISDITRPVKQHLPRYIEIEDHFQKAVYERFLGSPLTAEEEQAVDAVDDDILPWEFMEIMGRDMGKELPLLKSKPNFGFVEFSEVERQFREIFEALI